MKTDSTTLGNPILALTTNKTCSRPRLTPGSSSPSLARLQSCSGRVHKSPSVAIVTCTFIPKVVKL